MREGAFVIHKLQLLKMIYPEKSGDESVLFTTDTIRSLVKVSHPKIFEELWDTIRQLEEDHHVEARPIAEEGTHRKCFHRCGKVGHFNAKYPMMEQDSTGDVVCP